jgi:hypothetical protein
MKVQKSLQIYENKRRNPHERRKKGKSKFVIYGKFTIERIFATNV